MKDSRPSKEDSAKQIIIPEEHIERSILVFRGHRVILDSDLAAFYGVTTKRFNEQIKRNVKRFPGDFMFQLNTEEHAVLRSQIATLKKGRGHHRKYPPYAFTEHGAIMAASVISSPKAIEMSVVVVRAFAKLRHMIQSKRKIGFQ